MIPAVNWLLHSTSARGSYGRYMGRKSSLLGSFQRKFEQNRTRIEKERVSLLTWCRRHNQVEKGEGGGERERGRGREREREKGKQGRKEGKLDPSTFSKKTPKSKKGGLVRVFGLSLKKNLELLLAPRKSSSYGVLPHSLLFINKEDIIWTPPWQFLLQRQLQISQLLSHTLPFFTSVIN